MCMGRTSTRSARLGASLAVTVAAMGLAATPALAQTPPATTTVAVSAQTLVISGSDAADMLTITQPSPPARSFMVTDSAGLLVGSPECTQDSTTQVTCTSDALRSF